MFLAGSRGWGRFVSVYGAAVLLSVSASAVISSIGFGGGVVAMVYPIHAPMARIATNPIATGVATSQKRTFTGLPTLRKDMMYGS